MAQSKILSTGVLAPDPQVEGARVDVVNINPTLSRTVTVETFDWGPEPAQEQSPEQARKNPYRQKELRAARHPQTYDRSSGFGALTDPCPSPTNTGLAIPIVKIRYGRLTTV
jgi:hypothetical protein